jgi:2-phospho-L-lactate transferase/gluconeogenesis factor (CofD/UPF0052 family)
MDDVSVVAKPSRSCFVTSVAVIPAANQFIPSKITEGINEPHFTRQKVKIRAMNKSKIRLIWCNRQETTAAGHEA